MRNSELALFSASHVRHVFQFIKLFIPSGFKPFLRQLRMKLPYYSNLQRQREERKILHRQRVHQSLEFLHQRENLVVLTGPFEGMKYIDTSNCSSLLPKIIGTYEQPLIPYINQVILNKYNYIYDVGCAEGYYAVGFQLSSPGSKVIAYDNNPEALNNCSKLAFLNSVDQAISLESLFDSNFLIKEQNKSLAPGKSKHLIFMDVEGSEITLLNPILNPDVLLCDLIVELHDCFIPGITQRVLSYFEDTHAIQVVYDYPWRKIPDLNGDLTLDDEMLEFSMNEFRPKGMSWLVAIKRDL